MTAKKFVEQLNSRMKEDPGFRRKPGVMSRGWETKCQVAILVIDEASHGIRSRLMAPRLKVVLARASIQGDQQVPSTQTGPQVGPGGMGPTQENKDDKTS